MSEFKKLRGRSILLDIPERKKSVIKLSEKDEEALLKEAVKLWNKLTVYAVGDKVEDVVVGDQVYIRIASLNFDNIEKIEINDCAKLLFNEGDVVLIW